MSDIEALIRNIVRDELAKATPANDSSPEHLTVDQYAKRWSISTSTVRQAIRDKRLSCTRIGRAVRIDAAARIAPRVDEVTAKARLVLMGGKR